MSNEKQVRANQNNSKKSTGPQTQNGKERSKLNARKHGLFSEVCVLPDEDLERFNEFANSMRQNLSPVGDLEDLFVDRIISSSWRLRRLVGVEVGSVQNFRNEEDFVDGQFTDKGVAHAFIKDAYNADSFTKLNRYEATLERSITKALHELQRIQAMRQGHNVQLPIAMDIDISGGKPMNIKD